MATRKCGLKYVARSIYPLDSITLYHYLPTICFIASIKIFNYTNYSFTFPLLSFPINKFHHDRAHAGFFHHQAGQLTVPREGLSQSLLKEEILYRYGHGPRHQHFSHQRKLKANYNLQLLWGIVNFKVSTHSGPQS